ncbi:MAG: ParB/RepB/Spo0J family partition protein [Cryomorphaceae bacterium]|nr:MAG: ParB/RepB/Spo0J family partition protein [Cryomorphaceae bacterium]|tara:strand:+ start:150 stop:1013 length:864 start_codon:yes stop_codon:yes gene_type:complete
MAKAYKKRSLGRGLSSILNDDENNILDQKNNRLFNEIEIDLIDLNPFQPRTNFNTSDLEELTSSIDKLGLIQPITIKKNNGRFTLISGERRLKAFKKLSKKSIPAYIRLANDQESLEMALVENIQRKNLDPIEIAISYSRLTEELKISHEEMSKRVGKDRTTITNYIRLLKLDPIIQSGLRDNFISMGHGRALININSFSEQLSVYEKIVKKSLSVRDTEKLVSQIRGRKSTIKKPMSKYYLDIKDQIQKNFETIVKFNFNKKTKSVSFDFQSEEKLKSFLKQLNEK